MTLPATSCSRAQAPSSCVQAAPQLAALRPRLAAHRPQPGFLLVRGISAAPRAATAAQAVKQQFSSFQTLIEESPEPVLVQFHATWCGPCLLMSQHVNEVAPQMKGVKFVKVDTEKYHNIAKRYNIAALPTLVLFKNGKPVDRVEGVLSASDLQSRLKYQLGIAA